MPDDTNEPEPRNSLKYHFMTIGDVLMVILVLLVPLPALLLDILWGLNLILILLTLIFSVTWYSGKDGYFSLLPSWLLILTVSGLLIQISLTRLILTYGEAFDSRIIRTLSSLMILSGGIIGLIAGVTIFLIFTTVGVLVAVKACTRISEVAARFALDSCVCKDMAIDVEYSSGAITEKEATAKRDALQRESDFYGAMDGLSKFISGNFKASLFFTAVGIIGGIAIGTLLKGETTYSAMVTYIPLSLCNGLLAQFLCLMESIIASHLVAWTLLFNGMDEKQASSPDPIRIELGSGLIPLVKKEFLEQFQELRRQLSEEIKIVIPKIRIVDNILLEADEYRILITEVEAGKWIIKPDCFLCIDPGDVKGELSGEKVCEPVGGLPAIWVSADQREEAERLGYTVADPTAVIVSHLREIVIQHTEEF